MYKWIFLGVLSCLMVFFACNGEKTDGVDTAGAVDDGGNTESGGDGIDLPDGDEGDPQVDTEVLVAGVMEEAQQRYPSFKWLHQNGVNPKCGPVGGVCHNTKEYPDLHTSANLIDVIGMGCNYLADNPPEIAENLCEPHGDVLILTSGPDVGFESPIGKLYIMPEMLPCGSEIPPGADVQDENGYPTLDLCISLYDAVPAGPVAGEDLISFSVIRKNADTGEQLVLMQYQDRVSTEAGSIWVRFHAFSDLDGASQEVFLYTIMEGDFNGDGVFGALTDEAGLIIKPGDPTHSYIVWRMLGWGRAPRMPLAEEPFDPPTQLALMCWIQGLKKDEVPNPKDPIDYSQCDHLSEFLVFDNE